MTPEEFLATLLGRPIRMDTNQGGVVVPVVQGPARPLAQQPRATYHNIPVAVRPDGQLQRDPRVHAAARVGPTRRQRDAQRGARELSVGPVPGTSALGPLLYVLQRSVRQPHYRGADPSTAPRSVQVPR